MPVALSDAALVNAVATTAEAKVQALRDAGVYASGTPTDAVCLAALTPAAGRPSEPFAGPRSLWGAHLTSASSSYRKSWTRSPRVVPALWRPRRRLLEVQQGGHGPRRSPGTCRPRFPEVLGGHDRSGRRLAHEVVDEHVPRLGMTCGLPHRRAPSGHG
ncbi:adenosylcobinamide amidohydrolase [Streptomyces xanthophaeus]